MITIEHSAATKIVGYTETSKYEIAEEPQTSDGIETPASYNDSNYLYVDSGVTDNSFRITPEASFEESSALINRTPSVVSVDNNGLVSAASEGLAKVEVKVQGKAPALVRRDMVQNADGLNYLPNGFVAGSLGAHVLAAITDMVDGLVYSTDNARFADESGSVDGADLSYVRRAECFVSSLDLTGIAIRRGDEVDNDAFPVALISDRHGLCNEHCQPRLNGNVSYMTSGGVLRQAEVIGKESVPGSLDLMVVYFDAPIVGCSIVKTLPQDGLETYVPSVYKYDPANGHQGHNLHRSGLPILRKARSWADPNEPKGSNFQIDFVGRVGGGSVNYVDGTGLFNNAGDNTMLSNITDEDWPFVSHLKPWSRGLGIGGDSGGQSILPINGEPIIIAGQFSGGTADDVSIFVDAINDSMNNLAGTTDVYALQHPDLSGFTSY